MIQKIAKLKNVGIFENFTADSSLSDFKKFNLFYGWNGSGKTTISRFLNSVERENFLTDFQSGEYEIQLADRKVTHKSNSSLPFKLYVFNQEFINNNIDWNKNGAKSIVVISESKIEERNQYMLLKDKKIPEQNRKVQAATEKLNNSNKEVEAFLTAEAKSIKQSFQVIDTGDSYFVSYDKRKLRNFIDNKRSKILAPESVLSSEDLILLHKKVKPIEKSIIEDSYTLIDVDKIDQARIKINQLLNIALIDTSIDRLNNNRDINEWVKLGVQIHKAHESTNCEYCGEMISAVRLKELNLHFSDLYLDTVSKINSAINWLTGLFPDLFFHDKGLLFEELCIDYTSYVEEVKVDFEALKLGAEEWLNNLQRKADNPFFNDFADQIDLGGKVQKFNQSLNSLKELIRKHNDKVESFDEQLKIAKSQLELHYVAESVSQKGYFDVLDRIRSETQLLDAEKKVLDLLMLEFSDLEAILSDAALAADEFNVNLHKFLGRAEITLAYDSKEKGFKIYRGAEKKHATNLSEGEKTAIAFTYFIAKLKENGNEIKDSILVIDDPISSFDSNHLYHSFACLRDICEKAKQAFILTHNFQYFKLVRDWLVRKNVDKAKVKASFYSIESGRELPRISIIKNCHDSLIKYGSEYHFIYLKLREHRSDSTLDLASACLVANLSRKVLESFLSFKFPKGRNSFKDLLEAGHQDRILTEKVYRFINKYSHVDGYDIDTTSIDNLLAEGNNIVDEVFRIIKEQDSDHYAEMEQLESA
ncbi:AAA family ATPase [Sphingobacterium chuzhouense]|uniref:AAA family ATPase n=1 Tax=Sphingobacterium chuzhouense TaxID=1742264 RepID=A0ABR7XS41_9SPHI|nr:AAA family ATPase [Sphingobacterium chuzhouense]MBD1421991.1 AAA family ATPase [Sphingobacterium chuzhouense]